MLWTRETTWRQGSIISTDDLRRLGVIGEEHEVVGIAVSHDCDIANADLSAEPCVEFIIGCVVGELNGHFAYSKNPRTLHIPVENQDGIITCELQAKDKVILNKDVLYEFKPSPEIRLSRKTLNILQTWLAARYTRHTLPNSLVDRLSPVFNFLQSKGKKKPRSLIGYWLDYSPFNEELPASQDYELWIYLVYSIDESDAQEHIGELAGKLVDKFPTLIGKNRGAGNVDLRECESYSEAEFTLSDIRGTIEYHLDNISLKLDPPGPTSSS